MVLYKHHFVVRTRCAEYLPPPQNRKGILLKNTMQREVRHSRRREEMPGCKMRYGHASGWPYIFLLGAPNKARLVP